MDNLMESNERTLIMFDSVCAGLAACLALVHNDIRQMTEHRNRLAQLEHDQIQAKLIPTQELAAEANQQQQHHNHHHNHHHHHTAQKKKHPTGGGGGGNHDENNSDSVEDPHHLAGLKLLDKRLADSFSQALSLNDQHKSSITAKQHASQSKPTIFQVLLGKSHKSTSSETSQQKRKNNNKAANKDAGGGGDDDESAKVVDNKAIIDDINRQTRLAMQYAKQLEANLFKLEDLRSKYEMHLKMGLVVKSVSRAYLATSSPNTLARRHHSSSLIVNNDSSSLGTQSSLSSLNLSTWSSSRSRAAAQRRRTSTSNDPRLGAGAFVSTLSLNGKQNKRLNKLISANEQNNPAIGNSNNNNNNSDYAYNDWVTPDLRYTTNNNNNTLSKSNAHLNASSSSLKKAAKSGGGGPSAASKTTIKEFIENIDRIEAEFESYMGSFLLAIEDIQGFARVCQGDVFEISIKYGDSQKFKTRITVLKDNRQRCDNRQAVLKARIADVLAIKAYECKGLGKRVLLGHKLCETRDLFTARSQLMTISLNQTGSIKLNLIVTWNPLHMAPNSSSALQGVDISHVSLPATPISSSTLSSLSSVPSLSGATTTINIQSQQRNSNKIHHQHHSQHHNHLHHSPVPAQYLDPHETSMYQTVDPTYGYYVPPPDYVTNNQ